VSECHFAVDIASLVLADSSLAGPQRVAYALGHAVQAAAHEVAAEAMLRELLVVAAWLEDRALW
jgi:hypothetical protein